MNNNTTIDKETRDGFWAYFDLADELWPEGDPAFQLTLDDFEDHFVAHARTAADALGLPWPPYRPEAENFLLDHYKELRSNG